MRACNDDSPIQSHRGFQSNVLKAPLHGRRGSLVFMHSRQELADAFRALGVGAGDTVMLHASIRAAGPIAGGPDEIHLALKDALTPDGTLIMYASCPAY